jgi:hypothetical protein
VTRRIFLFLCALAACLTAFAAELPTAWRHWRYSRPVADISVTTRTPAEIRLPWEVFPHSEAQSADFRLIDDRGQEVPYVIAADQGEPGKRQALSAKLIENSFVPGQFTQVIADFGERPPAFNQVRIETPESDFILWVELALSDNARLWRVVNSRAPISRFHSRSIEGAQTISLEGLPARYVRLRLAQGTEQFPVTAVEGVFTGASREPERTALPVKMSMEASADSTETRWRVDCGTPNFPISEVAFKTDQPEFYRAVRVQTSDDGEQWGFRASGTIYRYRQGDALKEQLRVVFSEFSGARYWRIEVVNGNDPALAGVAAELRGVPRRMHFLAQPGRTYRLLYGNLAAKSPQYDVGHLFAGMPAKPVYAVASLGGEELNAGYADPRPFTERHPVVLWVALAIAIAVLGFAALRALRSGPAARVE